MNRLLLLLNLALVAGVLDVSAARTAIAGDSLSSGNVSRGYSIPMLNLTPHDELFSVVERRETYLGHPSAVLLRDGRTLLVAYPDGHGRGNLILRRSTNAAASWETVKIAAQRVEETPILYRLDLPGGGERVLLVTCRPNENVLEWMWSDDRGNTWSDREQWKLEGPKGIIVALASLWPVPGNAFAWRGVFHDRDFDNFTVDLHFAADGKGNQACRFDNLRRIDYASAKGRQRAQYAGLCEAGVVTRPDGKRLALLFRPEKRRTNSMISFSDDGGLTWSDPRELPGSLTGHRHQAQTAADGRIFMCFRDYSPLNAGNPSHGDWVGWVGTFEDLEQNREGQYRLRLRRNYGNSTNDGIGDCGYSSVERLPNGTFVAISYGHWDLAPESKHPNHPDGRGKAPYIICAKIDLRQADEWARRMKNER